jgi:hypothetical protein
MLNKNHLLLGLFSNISSLGPCIELSPFTDLANNPYIRNCSFENIRSSSPTSSCIDFHHSYSTFNFSDCSFRNISSLHPDGADAVYLNMDGSYNLFSVSGNQFIDITSKRSVFNMYRSSLYFDFKESSFINISVEQNGGVYFYLIFFFRIFLLILFLLILFLFSGNLL